jgi:pyruvate carboxylase
VTFQVDGETWYFDVTDHSILTETTKREKAIEEGDIGSPMPGVIVGLKVKVGDKVNEGEPLASLSAMKMETMIPATTSGTVERVLVNVGDKVDADDLLISIV